MSIGTVNKDTTWESIFLFHLNHEVMKSFFSMLVMLVLCCACISNPLDSGEENQSQAGGSLKSVMTKSGTVYEQEDSLSMMSRHQKDVNHLMMNRIIFRDSSYVLAIRRQDAIFLGVSEETYDRYVEYVAGLNSASRNQ